MMQEGDALPTVEKSVSQQQIESYARASGDFNPIHVDKEFAARSQFGGTIAHGMMIVASISEMMSLAFGPRWATGGHLKLRFKAPVRPGDSVTTSGKVKRVGGSDRGHEIACTVEVHRQTGEVAITGDATVTVPPSTGN